jgi:hypothetical protein
MNGHFSNFESNQRKYKKISKTCTQSPLCVLVDRKQQTCKLMIKTTQILKWAIMSESSWLSTQMIMVMAISVSYFVIIFPNYAYKCILAWQTKGSKWVSNFLSQKIVFPFYVSQKWRSVEGITKKGVIWYNTDFRWN